MQLHWATANAEVNADDVWGSATSSIRAMGNLTEMRLYSWWGYGLHYAALEYNGEEISGKAFLGDGSYVLPVPGGEDYDPGTSLEVTADTSIGVQAGPLAKVKSVISLRGI